MKHVYYFVFATLLLAVTVNSKAIGQMQSDSVEMGPGYANDIYYSMQDGFISSVDRRNWDLGFYTSAWSAGIIINDGNGSELYVYPSADTSGWMSIDTAGLSSWPVLYNSVDDWEMGAFNVNEKGHPDYGWGVYNTINHDVVGDSLYIIKLMNGTDAIFKKLWIERKISDQNTYIFKYADLDGSNEHQETLIATPYTSKNFVYYSLQTNEVLDREPNSDTWDILFTKYNTILEGGSPYIVTSVVNNVNVPSKRYDEVGPDFNDWGPLAFDSARVSIGHDWKEFDMGSLSYIVDDSIAFFLSTRAQDVYKLVFKVFDYTVGKVVFQKSLTSLAGVSAVSKNDLFSVYPNPASNYVVVESEENTLLDEVKITDVSGKTIYKTNPTSSTSTIAIDQLNNGLYFVIVTKGKESYIQKLIIGK